jgi:hypothetical protein
MISAAVTVGRIATGEICHALALYFEFFNFCRIHKRLRPP